MAVPIQPFDEYVVLQAEEAKTKTAAGILLPDSAQTAPDTYKVVAVGKGVDRVKVGDRVIYQNDYEVKKVTIDDVEYVVLFHKNLIGKVK